jgi:tetratricopeptide (TPR) repeat protein
MEYSGNYDDVNGLYEEALDLATIDDEECIRCYDEIIGINSGEGMAWRGKGLALGRLERPQEAIDCFDKALEIDPYDDLSQRSKDIQLEEIKAIDPITHSPDASSLVTKGLDLQADSKYDEAIQCYDEALKINPNDESVWENKANALASLDKDKEAIQCYDEALKINPENDRVLAMKDQLTNLVDERASLEDKIQEGLEESIDDPEERERLRRNLENFADPENAFMEGMRFFQLKNYKEAIPYLKKAKSSPEVDGMLGMCLRNIQNYDESITYFDKALSVEPENDMFLNSKGYSLRDLERWDEYVTIQTKLLKINPLDDHALYSKGIGLTELSKYDEAFFCYDKALEINPNSVLALNGMGLGFGNFGEYSEAERYFKKSLEFIY